MPKGYSPLKPGTPQKSQNNPKPTNPMARPGNANPTRRRNRNRGSRAQLTLNRRRCSWHRNGFLFQKGGFKLISRCIYSVLKRLSFVCWHCTLCFPKQTFAVRSAPSSSKALRIHPEEQREDVASLKPAEISICSMCHF